MLQLTTNTNWKKAEIDIFECKLTFFKFFDCNFIIFFDSNFINFFFLILLVSLIVIL